MTSERQRSRRGRARDLAHTHFDPLWESGRMSRTEAYARLAQAMLLTEDECHMRCMKPKACREVVWLCKGALEGVPVKGIRKV